MNYADKIRLSKATPVCDILSKEDDYWKAFVPNDSFYEILENVGNSLDGQRESERRSLWIQGAYGSGKSHAAIVVRHLLNDGYSKIEPLLGNLIEKAELRAKFEKIRRNKRYFTVSIKGSQCINNERTAADTIRQRVKETLKEAGIITALKTDCELMLETLQKLENGGVNLSFSLLGSDSPLSRYAANVNEIKEKIKGNDSDVLDSVEKVLSENFNIRPVASEDNSKETIVSWLKEAEQALKEKGYQGLIIFWDELTSLYKQFDSHPEIWNMFQSIAEVSQKRDHDIFLYLISHKRYDLSGDYGYSTEERKKNENHIKDRFHMINYVIEPVTTYAIMAQLIQSDKNEIESFHSNCGSDENFHRLFETMRGHDSALRLDSVERIFPLHPATAYLCSFIAKNIGSSNRSIFEFITDKDRGFAAFLQNYEAPEMCTPDFLWDYFVCKYNDNQEDFSRCSDVIGKWHKNKDQVTEKYKKKVFAALLLLNAIARMSSESCELRPCREHLLQVFAGVETLQYLDEALDEIHNNRIIKKDPSGFYTIENYADLPEKEIKEEEENLRSKWKSGKKLLDDAGYDIEWLDEKDGMYSNLPRIKKISTADIFLPYDESQTKKTFERLEGDYKLNLFFFFCLNQGEIEETRRKWSQWISEKQSFIFRKNIVVILLAEPLREERLNDYIKYQALANLYKRRNRGREESDNEKKAHDILKLWLGDKSKPFYVGWDTTDLVRSPNDILIHIRKKYCQEILFNAGGEYFSSLSSTGQKYWKREKADKLVRSVLEAQTQDKLQENLSSADKPLARFVFRDPAGQFDLFDNDLTSDIILRQQGYDDHPLNSVRNFIETNLSQYSDGRLFNIAEVLSPLSRPPYGLYQNKLSLLILALCLKRYMGKIYDSKGPIDTTAQLAALILSMTAEWMEAGSKDKCMVRFDSKDEKDFRKYLEDIFKEISPQPDTSTYRSHVLHVFSESVNAPFWSLLYFRSELFSVAFYDAWRSIYNFLAKSDSDKTYLPEEYRQVNKIFNQFHHELTLYLEKEYFDEGFRNYILITGSDLIKGDLDVSSHIDDILSYLRKSMPENIDTWSEEDVQRKIQEWSESLRREVSPEPSDPEPPVNPKPLPPSGDDLEKEIKTIVLGRDSYIELLLQIIAKSGDAYEIVQRFYKNNKK